MKPHSLTRRVLACLFVFCHASAFAQNIPVPRYEEAPKTEADVPLPAAPQESNLLRYPLDSVRYQVFIDTASLVFGDDQTISYTMVIRGAGGGENVTFESLRCVSGDRRVHAYGKRDGGWSPARNNDWQPITDNRTNRQYFEFWRDVFCNDGTLVTRREALINIKQGGRPRDYQSPGE